MERLWAPWRMPYILSEAEREGSSQRRGCIFCDLPAEGAERARENLILACGDRAFVIMNRYPYNNGHVMVVPRRHVSDPSLLPGPDYWVVAELVRQAAAALGQAVAPHGINIGMNLGRTAGAGIHEHCHFHLVPRWDGDTNFMPIVAGAKVISEGLLQTYDRLLPHVRELVAAIEATIADPPAEAP